MLEVPWEEGRGLLQDVDPECRFAMLNEMTAGGSVGGASGAGGGGWVGRVLIPLLEGGRVLCMHLCQAYTHSFMISGA